MPIASSSSTSGDRLYILGDVDIDTVLVQTAYEYSWLTSTGVRITLRGGLAYSGTDLTAGSSVHTVEIDTDNNGSIELAYNSTSAVANPQNLTSGNRNLFWETLLGGDDVINYSNANAANDYMVGDGLYAQGTTTAGNDTLYYSAGGQYFTADYYGLYTNATLYGGADLIIIDFAEEGGPTLNLSGDVAIAQGAFYGGDDVFIDRTHPSLVYVSAVLYGDAVNSQSSGVVSIGGDDYFRMGDGDFLSLIGDIGGHYSTEIPIVGGDDIIISGDGGVLVVGDLYEIISYATANVSGGDDTISTGAGDDTIYGDTYIDNSGGGVLITGGEDFIQSGGGYDAVYGQNGNDTVMGGAEGDLIVGGNGSDLLIGGFTPDMASVNEVANTQGQFLAVYGADMIPTGELTIQFLFRSMLHESELEGTSMALMSYAAPSNTNEITIWANIGGNVTIDIAGNSGIDTGIATSELLTGAAHRLSLVYDPATNSMRFNLDGEQRLNVMGSMALDPLESGGILIFGQEQDRLGGDFDPDQAIQGQYGDIRIFDQALTPGQVVLNANAYDTLVPTYSGLVANWQGDAATGTMVNTVDPGAVMQLVGGVTIIDGGIDLGDVIEGGEGYDTLSGGEGDDTLRGGADRDTLLGGAGNDLLEAGDGAFGFLSGGDGDDTLVAGVQSQQISGGAGNDLIFLSNAADTGTGGDGDDTIVGGNSGAVLTAFSGGEGDDSLRANGGNVHFYGDGGNDVMDGANANGGVDFEGGTGGDTLIGSIHDDELHGDNDDDSISGGRGFDTIQGGQGNDTIDGGNNDDTIDGGANDDFILGGNGSDSIDGGSGNDVIRGGAGDDTVSGGNGADEVFGYGGADSLFGGSGLDTLRGGDGDDTLLGGAQDDVLFAGTGRDSMDGGDGNDLLDGLGGFDTLTGGAGDDTLTGGGNADTFVFADGFGLDVITDFAALNDAEVIDLSGVSAISDFTDLDTNHMSQVGANVVIDDLSGNTITLLNVTLGDLDGNDFLF